MGFFRYHSLADNWSDFSSRPGLFIHPSRVCTSAARHKSRPRKLFRKYSQCLANTINIPIKDRELGIDHLSKLQKTVVWSALERAVRLHPQYANASKAGKEILDTYFIL